MKTVTLADHEPGGVQNWRDTEMSETAQELPDIKVETPFRRRLGIGAGGLFLGSGLIYAALFYRDIGYRKHVSPQKREKNQSSDIEKGKRRK